MRNLLKILISIECKKHLIINMKNRSISRAEQKQKQQNDNSFANVCCFKLLEFVLFEFLLIDASWLIANFEQQNLLNKILTYWRRTKNCEKDEFIELNSKSIDLRFSRFHVIAFVSLYVKNSSFIDVDCENVKNRTNVFEIIEINSLIVVTIHWMSLKRTNSLKLTKRNET